MHRARTCDRAELTVDREEITVIGRIPAPRLAEGASDAEREAAVQGRIQEFRERTRQARIEVAQEAEHRFRRKVSWGVECGGERALFTHSTMHTLASLLELIRSRSYYLTADGQVPPRPEAVLTVPGR